MLINSNRRERVFFGMSSKASRAGNGYSLVTRENAAAHHHC